MTGPRMDICTPLPWDSAFFGVSIARLEGDRLTAPRAEEALEWCAHQRVACLYFLADPSDPVTVRVARQYGFDFVDIRVTLERRPPLSDGVDDATIRPARPDDLEALRAIAREAHTDSRFFFDGRFPVDRCRELYATWIDRSCREAPEGVLVAVHEGRAAGYLACTVGEGTGRIGLVGVASTARGAGLGHGLVSAALGWCAARHAQQVSVVTQGRNVPAQSLYQGHGFRTSKVELWYHRWLQDDFGA